MLKELKQQVYEANLRLPAHGLVTFTWGNVSGIDRGAGLVVIKPSGVSYEDMRAEDMAVVDLATGETVEGALRPSSDTPAHLELYRRFEGIGGVVHTHSRWATVFAQAGREILPLGTTHADDFFGTVPCTRPMTRQEIDGDYERETGRVIAEAFLGKNPEEIPAVLVFGHGSFAWGRDAHTAVHNAVVLEEAAFMAWHTVMLNENASPVSQALLDRHYLRKHGPDAYYGQK